MSDQATEYRRTKRLYWEPSYVPKEAIYPPANYEGIHFKDWDRWDDPFHMSFKQYVEIQAKKDNGFHPARDAFDRYGGSDRIDRRWLEGMKVVYPILFHGEYGALRSHARVSRYAPAPALRAAAFYQSIDELRHSQNHVYQMRMLNKHTDGFNNWAEWKRHHFLLQPAKMLFEDIVARHPPPAGPAGRHVRLYYATQTNVRPPTFVISTNQPTDIKEDYLRFLTKQLRKAYGFEGTPIRILLRARRKKQKVRHAVED